MAALMALRATRRIRKVGQIADGDRSRRMRCVDVGVGNVKRAQAVAAFTLHVVVARIAGRRPAGGFSGRVAVGAHSMAAFAKLLRVTAFL